MTKAHGYLRCSGLGQIGGDTFTRQRDTIEKFAATHGYELHTMFEEKGVSGKKDADERPAFSEMVAAIMGNGVRHILIENLTRLAREYRIQEQLLIFLASKGIQLISCDTGENITESIMGDPMRKAMVQIQGVFSELERSTLVKKLRVARDRIRVEKGRCEGEKPFGFRDNEKPYLDVIKALHAENKNTVQICQFLNTNNIPTRKGGPWFPMTVSRILKRIK